MTDEEFQAEADRRGLKTPYAQSRASLRKQFGARQIDGAQQSANAYVSPAIDVGSDAKRDSRGFTNENSWVKFFGSNSPKSIQYDKPTLRTIPHVGPAEPPPTQPYAPAAPAGATAFSTNTHYGPASVSFNEPTQSAPSVKPFDPVSYVDSHYRLPPMTDTDPDAILKDIISKNQNTLKRFGEPPSKGLAKRSTWETPAL